MNVQLLYDELKPLYEQLLEDVSYENCPSRPDEICTFCAQWGDKYEANDGVIFYGRAVNGWGTNENINSLFPQDFQNPNDEERTFNISVIKAETSNGIAPITTSINIDMAANITFPINGK